MFALFGNSQEEKNIAAKLYDEIIKQAREPVFYALYDVPDTIDGRFELICMHAYLVMERFFDEGRAGQKIAQALFDHMFRDMDKALREMGAGDLGVPRHVKRMMKGFNGRATSYRAAIESEDDYELIDVIKRNLYGTLEKQPEDSARIMALYIHETGAYLQSQPWDAIAQGQIEFKEMSDDSDEEDTGSSAGMVA